LQQNFGIRMGLETATGGFEFGLQLAIIVDFAVIDENCTAGGIDKGLVSAFEIEDGEAAMGDTHALREEEPLIIGAA